MPPQSRTLALAPKPANSLTLLGFLAPLNARIHGFRGFRQRWKELPFLIYGSAFNPAVFWIFPLFVFIYCDCILSTSEKALLTSSKSAWLSSLLSKGAQVGRFGDPLLLDSARNTLHTDTELSSLRPALAPLVTVLAGGYWWRLYLLSIGFTLLLVEAVKHIFRSPRPDYRFYASGGSKSGIDDELGLVTTTGTRGGQDMSSLVWHRHFTFPLSLKSKYSHPSGDSAQAGNFAAFLYFFGGGDLTAFLLVTPGVCFSRVFYCCHWIEDTIMGAILGIAVNSFLAWLLGAF